MSGLNHIREASICAAIIRKLSEMSGLVIRKRWGGGMGVAGDPDLTGCFRGRHFELEVKVPGRGRLTKLQQARLEDWRCAGAITAVVTSVDEALAALGIEKSQR